MILISYTISEIKTNSWVRSPCESDGRGIVILIESEGE